MTIIIDANSLGHANHNGSVLTVGDMQVQAIFGFTRSMRNLLEMYPGWTPVVLWDGDARWRKDLYPEYKGNREAKSEEEVKHKEAYQAQLPILKKLLKFLGVRQMVCSEAEADDLAGIISSRLSKSGQSAVVVTGDKDWIQMVTPNVVWFDPIRDRKVTHGKFFEATGYANPAAFLDGKALRGDTSDNIKGVGGIGEKGAPEFLAEFKSVDNFFEMVDSGVFVPKKKAHINLASVEGRRAFFRNRTIMNLLNVPSPEKHTVTVTPGEFNPDAARIICERLAFASILRDFEGFIAPFENVALKKAA